MGILPELGSTYTCFDAFRIASFERGVQHGLLMNTKATSAHSQYNTCAHKIGPEKKWCTFQVSALIRNGVPTVTTVNERHSCLVNLAEYSKEARFTMQEKVKKLKKKFKEKENERASAVKKRTIAARQGIDLGDEEEEEAFPSKTEIATEVKALLKLGPISVSSFDESFNTIRDLFIHIHALAQQEGFGVYRRYKLVSPPRVQLACSRGQNRYDNHPDGRCHYAIKAEKQQGVWRVVEVNGNHNHLLHLPKHPTTRKPRKPQAYVDRTGSFSRDGEITYTSRSAPRPASRFHPYDSYSSHATSQLHSAPSTPPQDSFASPPPPLRLSAPTSHLSFSKYPVELISFLSSFDSDPSNLQHTLDALSRAEMYTVEELVETLAMNEEEFDDFTGSVDEELGDILVEMVGELQRDEAWIQSGL